MPLDVPKMFVENYVDDLNLILKKRNAFEMDCHIQQWLERASDLTSAEVKLKSASGRRMFVQVGTPKGARMLPIMPAGKKMDRQTALNLLREYGEKGQYRGKHRATGLTKFDYAMLPENTKARFKFLYPDLEKELENIDNDYLVHVPQTEEDFIDLFADTGED